MRRTEKIVSALEEALATVTQGYWHFDDNFGLSVTSDNPSEMAIQHFRGRNGESDLRYIALCSPENIRMLLAERRVMLAAHEQEPVNFDELRDAVAEMTGCRPMDWREGDSKGHQVVPFINFNSLSRIVEKFRTHPAPSIPAAVPEEVVKAILEIVRVRNDLHAFDGDKRGIAECLCEKEEALICLINEHHDDFRDVDGGAL